MSGRDWVLRKQRASSNYYIGTEFKHGSTTIGAVTKFSCKNNDFPDTEKSCQCTRDIRRVEIKPLTLFSKCIMNCWLLSIAPQIVPSKELHTKLMLCHAQMLILILLA